MNKPNFSNRTLFVGDNLDILRGMNSECVDLVYLDPPFNSNRNYSAPVGSKAAGAHFKDTWTWDDVDVAWLGQLADEHPKIASVVETTGIAHGRSMKSYVLMMAVRLMELKRVMKPSASIWLHCDDTASSYLRVLMDTIFGQTSCGGYVAWKRTTAHGDNKKNLGRVLDHLLFYRGEGAVLNPVYRPYDEDYVNTFYRRDDGDGRGPYRVSHLGNPNPKGYFYEYKGRQPPANGWRCPEETMKRYDEEGILFFAPRGKRIDKKLYLRDMPGKAVDNHWDDINKALGGEKVGYPTQKPLALLERIIAACTNEGDFVLDPFAGCATTCIAAEKLGRQWAGIDLSSLAVDLVARRLKETEGLFDKSQAARQAPMRTDVDAPPHYRKQAHEVYGKSEGNCHYCGIHFPFKLMEIDHVVPKSKGGTDHIENLVSSCSHCNRSKGNMDYHDFIAKIGGRKEPRL